MSFYSVVDFIREHYPEYYGLHTYPKSDCVQILRLQDEWGVFSNFAATPLVVEGVAFPSAEHLYQLMKFTDPRVVANVRKGVTANGRICRHVKMTAKSYEQTYRRPDWGRLFLDALKFCLVQKYRQCELFRQKLEASRGKSIVENQDAFPKKNPDAWGVKSTPDGIHFKGPNLQGRLLMELRSAGTLEYRLPPDALDFIRAIQLARE